MKPEDARGDARRRSPSVATFLSFLWPGLGQWYLGHRRSAAIYGLPVAGIAAIVVVQMAAGLERLAITFLTPRVALTAVILVGLLGLWRLISMADALSDGGRRPKARRARPLAVFVVLGLVVVASHAYLGWVAWSVYEAGSVIFVAESGSDSAVPPGAPAPGSSQGMDIPVTTPIETPLTERSRINILLLGIDSSERRRQALTDTLIVVSIDPLTKSVAMVSFPRDLAGLPLWNGGTFRGKVNSLVSYATRHPDEFPDGGLPALTRELGYLLGVPIHYYAAVNLDGLQRMVDLVGGVDVVVESAIDDPVYGGWTDGRPIGFHLSVGRHHLDGANALAYARSRMGPGDNDFTRARRQQQLLIALQTKLTDPAMLPQIPALLGALAGTIRTNFPSDRTGEMVGLGREIPETAIRRVVLGPTRYADRDPDRSEYRLVLKMDAVAALSVSLFGSDSRYVSSAPASPSPVP